MISGNPDTVRAAPQRGFATPEFEARVTRAQKMMAAENLDALLLTTEPEFRYFSGFLSRFWQSPTRPWFLVVPASGKPVAVVPSIGAECLAATWLDDVRSWPSPQPDDEGISLLADTLREVGGRKARIATPQGPETHLRMPLGDFHRLGKLLPDVEFAEATDIIKNLRMIKSPAELEKISHICGIVSGVFETLPARLAAGMSEIEIFRQFKVACLAAGADDVDYLVGGAGPGGYADIITPPSSRRVGAGDVLMLDTGTMFDGYFCDFDRNFAFGHVNDETERAYAALLEATQAGFEAVRPGSTCTEVYWAMQRVLGRDYGNGSGVGRMGHGLGMQLTEWPSFAANDDTILRPGMALTLEPSITLPGNRILVHEENLVLGPQMPSYLTRCAPGTLPVVEL